MVSRMCSPIRFFYRNRYNNYHRPSHRPSSCIRHFQQSHLCKSFCLFLRFYRYYNCCNQNKTLQRYRRSDHFRSGLPLRYYNNFKFCSGIAYTTHTSRSACQLNCNFSSIIAFTCSISGANALNPDRFIKRVIRTGTFIGNISRVIAAAGCFP